MAAITEHPCFNQPDNDVFVWRYFELDKFIDLLISGQLNFARADQFEDPYEGCLSLQNYNPEIIKHLLSQIPPDNKMKIITQLDNLPLHAKYTSYISCWHMNNFESMAMWKLYSKTKNSIAIKCRYSKLISVLPKRVYVGLVHYYDYENDILPMNNLFYYVMSKRKEYMYEQEIRAVYSVPEIKNEKHFKIPVNLNQLIDTVYISPSCSSYFEQVVRDIILKYGYSFQITKSELLRTPKQSLQKVVL